MNVDSRDRQATYDHGLQQASNGKRKKSRGGKKTMARRALELQILEEAEHLVAVWNERQAKRMPMLFSPTIGAVHSGRLLVPVGTRPGMPHDRRR